MQWLRKAAVLGLALMLAPAVVAACLLPFAELTPAERECCRQIAADCGRGQMPDAHSCCRTTAGSETVVFAATKSFSIVSPLALAGWACAATLVPDANFAVWQGVFSAIHSPPESPPGSTTVLRI